LTASWYSKESLVKEGSWKNGKEQRTASGERFDEKAYTCATNLYEFGTILSIQNLRNGNKVKVRVNDRIGKRFSTTRIDLPKLVFSQLDKLEKGIIPIKVEKVK
jgi:rare lipoprotein A